MAGKDAVALRFMELRLMRCTIPSDHRPLQSSPSVSNLLNEVVTLIESGHYLQALSKSKTVFSDFKLVSPDVFYNQILPDSVTSFLLNNNNNDEYVIEQDSVEYKALLLMAFGVAALLAFTQSNVTGPQEKLLCMPLKELFIVEDDEGDGVTWMLWDVWAHKELMSVGSDLRGKFSNLQYLIFAKIVLQRTKDMLFERFTSQTDGLRSITWWLGRVLFLQQRLLDERSSHLFDLLQVFKQETLSHFGTLKKIEGYWSVNEDSSTALSMLHIELGIMELFYGRVDATRVHFDTAAEVADHNCFVSGALGYRTVHQVEPKAQLRLVRGTKIDADALLTQESSTSDDSILQQSNETSEVSDVLMTLRFVAEKIPANGEQNVENHDISAPQLKAVNQVMVLAECIFIQKRARDDEMQKWEMAPYIEAVDSQNTLSFIWEMAPYIEAVDSQNTLSFILRYFCDILRVRWESTWSKTKQRSLLMMEKLVQRIYDTTPGASKRIYFSFGLNIPTIPALRKEYADLLVSCGLTGEALKIYEDLELWDNLIYCYQLMDKKTAAVDLIKTRLTEKPSDPRLWCSLGDVTNDDSSYEKALEVSGQRSARAFRSLARSAYNRGDFEKSQALWESAMSLNSMHPDGWFALGAAALKSRDVDKALDAFTRAVQLDPENGEAWNNIACLHMIKKRSKESFIAFKEALKLKRDSWQMWENFSHVAADVGNYRQAMEAVMKILDVSKMKRIDCVFLERIMVEIEDRVVDQAKESMSCEADSLKTRETEHLTQLMGQILKMIVQSGGNSESWGLYARWHKLKGDLTMCSEALLKQVRSCQGSDLWKDKDRFVKFGRASLELCKVYQELALHGKSRKELLAAEMHLKSTIKQAVNFSDTKEFGELVVCLEEVQGSLKALT